MTEMTELRDSVLLDALGRGVANVQSSYKLAEQLDAPQRTIGFTVNRLRQEGHLIGSVHGEGYYLIETEEELAETIGHIEARKRGIDRTIAALQDSFLKRAVLA